jgi:hypothetical protein
MDQLTWIFLGCIALGISAATLFTDLEDILGGLVGAVAWALWALGATNLEYAQQSGPPVGSDAQVGIAFFGAGLAAIMLLTMLVGAGRLLDVRRAGFDAEGGGR